MYRSLSLAILTFGILGSVAEISWGGGDDPAGESQNEPAAPESFQNQRPEVPGPYRETEFIGPNGVPYDITDEPVGGIDDVSQLQGAPTNLGKEQAGDWTMTAPLFAEDDKPFTAGWYADHPNAWQATHPNVNAWAVATTAKIASWMMVTPSDVANLDSADSDPDVPVIDDTNTLTTPPGEGEWMSLGVFALAPRGVRQAERLIQLDLSRTGEIRGSHFDVLSDKVTNLKGAVDRSTMIATWSIGNGSVRFRIPINELTKPATLVLIGFPNGKATRWQLSQSK